MLSARRHSLRTTALLATAALGLLATSPLAARPGLPDPSFGPDASGQMTIAFPEGNAAAYAVASHPDGSLFITGSADAQLAFARVHGDGQVDHIVHSIEGTLQTWGGAVAVQPDGKIVIAGYAMLPGPEFRWLLCRVHSDGSLDATFAAAESNPGCQNNDIQKGLAFALAIDGDGRIVVAGSDESGVVKRAILRRFMPDGGPDLTFGEGAGIAAVPLDYVAPSRFYRLSLLPDGRILAAGTYDPGDSVMLAARFLSNGLRDTSFSEDGATIATFPVLQPGNRWAYATGIAALPDGGIAVAGPVRTSSEPSEYRTGIVKFTANGQPDPVFSSPGMPQGHVLVDPCQPGFACSIDAQGVAVTPDGGLLIGGELRFTGPAAIPIRAAYAMRTRADGSLDPGYGFIGDAVLQPGMSWNGTQAALAMTTQGDRVIVVGSDDSPVQRFSVARFTGGLLFDDGFESP